MRLRWLAAVVPFALLTSGLAPNVAAAATSDGVLSGTVRTAAGAAASGSQVSLVDDAGREVAKATTNAGGAYTLTALQGMYTERIVSTVAGRRYVAQIADVSVGSSTKRDVVVVSPIAPPVTVTGTVRDKAGAPVGGVAVSLWNDGENGGFARTAPDGTYRLTAVPGTFSVSAQVEPLDGMFNFYAEGLVLKRDTRLDLTVDRSLKPAVVRDEQRQPVAGATVVVESPPGGCNCRADFELFPGAGRTLVSWRGEGRTDSTGTTTIPLFDGDALIGVRPPEGRPDLAGFHGTPYPSPHPSPVVIVVASANSSPGPLVTFRGRLRDGTGRALTDMTMYVGNDQGSVGGAEFESDGSFSMTVPPGHYWLDINGFVTGHSSSGDSGGPDADTSLYVADVDLTTDRVQDITIPTRPLIIQVIDRNGRPAVEPVAALSTADPAHPVELFPGGSATGSLEDGGGSPNGTATLQVLSGATVNLAAGWPTPLGTATVDGHAASATIHLTAVTLKGTVRDERGPLPESVHRSTWVSLDSGPCNPPVSTGLDIQGGYSLPRMPGDYTLCLSDTEPWDWADADQVATDTLPIYWSISTPYHQTRDRTLDLTVPDAQAVTITAVDETGQSIRGILRLTGTTVDDNVAIGPGITGTGWVSNEELQSEVGQFHPLLFGRSTTDVSIAVNDEWGPRHFLATLSPGDEITAAIAVLAGAPSAPRNVSASVSGDRRTVTWEPPADPGDSLITEYLVSYEIPGAYGLAVATVTGSQTSRILPAFTNGSIGPDDFRVWVAAINDAGTGPAAPAVVPPGAEIGGPGGTPAPAVDGEYGQTTQGPAPAKSGYWALDSGGKVYNFGDAPALGDSTAGAVDLEPTPTGKGYWTLNRNGKIQDFGDGVKLGDVEAATLGKGEQPVSLSATPSGKGYWVFTNRGRAITFGDAPFLGDMSGVKLNGPILGSVATPSGKGYYLVASDGGIFAFGDAAFAGSMGGQKLNAPVQGLVPDADGKGYWLVASDGGIFAFDAPFRGSMGGTKLNKPVVGMVRYGDGYLMVGADGGIFNFSSLPFSGSLGDRPPASPVVAVAALP